jgi:hypothetical protein
VLLRLYPTLDTTTRCVTATVPLAWAAVVETAAMVGDVFADFDPKRHVLGGHLDEVLREAREREARAVEAELRGLCLERNPLPFVGLWVGEGFAARDGHRFVWGRQTKAIRAASALRFRQEVAALARLHGPASVYLLREDGAWTVPEDKLRAALDPAAISLRPGPRLADCPADPPHAATCLCRGTGRVEAL